MYTERFSLSFVATMLLAAAERRRPGLGPWTDASRETLREVFESELAEIRRPFFDLFGDAAYWSKLEKAMREGVFERYCAVAEKQTALERRDYGVWRGGDLLARGAYAVGGLAIGAILVYVPFIPIPRTWDFVILLGLLGAPFLPDWQVSRAQKKYAAALAHIVDDVKAAEAAQRLYAPITRSDDAALIDAAMAENTLQEGASASNPAPRTKEKA